MIAEVMGLNTVKATWIFQLSIIRDNIALIVLLSARVTSPLHLHTVTHTSNTYIIYFIQGKQRR